MTTITLDYFFRTLEQQKINLDWLLMAKYHEIEIQ